MFASGLSENYLTQCVTDEEVKRRKLVCQKSHSAKVSVTQSTNVTVNALTAAKQLSASAASEPKRLQEDKFSLNVSRVSLSR